MSISRRWDYVGYRREASGGYDSIQYDCWPYSTSADALNALTTALAGANGIINSPHPDYPDLLCYRTQAVKRESPTKWTFQVDYAQPPGGAWPDTADPTTAPPVVRFRFKTVTLPIDTHDLSTDKNPLVNSAGDPFDPPQTYEKTTLIITITRWVSTFDPVAAITLISAMNLDTPVLPVIGAVIPGTLKILNMTPVNDMTGLMTVPLNTTTHPQVGTFIVGETVAGQTSGSGVVYSTTPSELTLVKYSKQPFISGDTITGASSGAVAYTQSTTTPPAIKLQIEAELDPQGHMKKVGDFGGQAFYYKGTAASNVTTFKGKVMMVGNPNQSAGIVRLLNGTVAERVSPSPYVTHDPKFFSWTPGSAATAFVSNTDVFGQPRYNTAGPVAKISFQMNAGASMSSTFTF